MPEAINNRVTLDSNVFISAIKENEKYSKGCIEILNLVGESFVLYQPTMSITELYNAVGKTKDEPAAKKALKITIKWFTTLKIMAPAPSVKELEKQH